MFVNSAGSTGNAILGNSIHSNGSLGIALDNDGVTANDAGDADVGPNNLQNFPDIGETDFFGGVLRVTYRVNAEASHVTFPLRVEFSRRMMNRRGRRIWALTFTARQTRQPD